MDLPTGSRLNTAERQIIFLHLLPGRATDKDIARLLYRSWRTIEHHRTSIREKYGVPTFEEAVGLAREELGWEDW